MNNYDDIIKQLSDKILSGKLTPWGAEDAALEAGVLVPDNFTVAAKARRLFIEKKSGVKLNHLVLPKKPYAIEYRCPNDDTHWILAANDEYTKCGLCNTDLVPLYDDKPSYVPLVNSYVGGEEDHFSYAGEITVGGEVEKTFNNILCYGPGVGHIGISVGSRKINKFGPVEIKVEVKSKATRNLSFVFDTESERLRAQKLIESQREKMIEIMESGFLKPYNGKVYKIDFLERQHHGDRILHCGFYTMFTEYRGHGGTSKSVGAVKNFIDDLFKDNDIKCRLSVIGMGRDGDLKPSPRNRRGRYVSAQQRIPVKEFEKLIGRPIEDFLSHIELDKQGVLEETGWPAYTGMGGEIIPAFYRTLKNNPRPYLVSSFQKVYAYILGDDLIFGVEIPNLEVGFPSGSEGIVPPLSREVAKIMGIHSSKDFAADCAAITLAGEFNFILMHLREKLYTGR